MAEEFTREQKNEILFLNLVLMFQTSAMQQMGKLKNPLTDKIERDLQQAQASIDILDMFREKTKGNLSENEAKFLDRVVSELKLNYVDEVEKDRKREEEADKEKGEAKAEEETKAEAEAPTASVEAESDTAKKTESKEKPEREKSAGERKAKSTTKKKPKAKE